MAKFGIAGNTSGSVTLQAPNVAGTTTVSLPATNVAIRGGADYATLSSGTPNITLTSSSSQLQVITATAEGQTITLPDMTTCTKGTGFFTFYNTSSYAVGVKDAGGTVREYLYPSATNSPISSVALNIEDTSTANGVWHLQNPISAGTFASAGLVSTSFTLTQTGYSGLVPIPNNPTQFILYGMATTQGNTPYIKLATLNTSTKTFTFGSQITLTASNASNAYGGLVVDWNGSDRGVILMALRGNGISGNSTIYTDIYGFTISGGTLYVSSNSRISMSGLNNPYSCNSFAWYTGSDDCFVVSANVTSSPDRRLMIAGFKVNVSGTTVTLTGASGNTISYGGSSIDLYLSPTSKTTFVFDESSNTTKTYINYNTSTNTLTSGNRTSQTTLIAGNLINNIYEYQANSQSFIAGTSGAANKYVFGTSVYSSSNAGTASVTVTNQSYNLKSFPAKSYASVTTGVGTYSFWAVSSSSYNILYGATGTIFNCDPTNSNFNFNQASISLPTGAFFYSSPTTITCYAAASATTTTGTLYCNIVSPAVPFVG